MKIPGMPKPAGTINASRKGDVPKPRGATRKPGKSRKPKRTG